jgi:hypothetical protein
MDLYRFPWSRTSNDIQDIGPSIARQRFDARKVKRITSYFSLLTLKICEVGCSFFVADDDNASVAMVENFSEVDDVLLFEQKVKACQALTAGLAIPLTVLTDTVLALVVDEDEVASTHFCGLFLRVDEG